jgi:hypothetical protein
MRSKAWACGRSLAGIMGSNPAGNMNVCFECCMLLGRGLCIGPITRPEESYRLWRVSECDREAPRTGGAMNRKPVEKCHIKK